MEVTQRTQSQTQPTQQSPTTQTQTQSKEDQNRICQLICSTGQFGNYDLNINDKTIVQGKMTWYFGRDPNSDLQVASSSRISNKHFQIWFNFNDKSLWIKDTSTNGTHLNNSRLVKGSNYLLNQGDEIAVGVGRDEDVVRFVVVFGDKYNPAKLPDSTNTIKDEGIYKDFIVKNETIGQGAFATVKKAIERSTGESYAVKIINRRKALNTGGGSAMAGVDRELSILERLNHPNIVALKAFYEDMDNYYIVMELVPGGDLMDFVAANGAIGEDATQVITKQILEGIAYVHNLGISHRDLKPDNILIMQDDPILVKITDFGLAKFSDNSTFMKTFCGTLAYVAPEVITGKYGSSQMESQQKDNYSSLVDIWSLGCLVYVLLTSHLPFNGKNQQQMFAKIKRGEFHEAPLNSYDISEDGRDFLQCCLQVNPKLRMTAAEALKHKWLQDLYEEDSVKSLSLSQSQSQQSRKIDNGIHIESLSKIDEDVMLRPLDSERNRKSSKQQDFKVPKRVIPLSQHPATPLPMSQPKKRPYQIDPRTNKKVDLEEPSTSKKVKLSDSVVAEDYLKLEPSANSLFQETINISKSPFSFGRNDTCDCEIDDDRLSKLHCVITKENDSIWLLDKSTNSCLVNNTSVGKGNKVLLRGGEILHLFFDPLSSQHIGFKVVLVDQSSGEHKSQVEVLKQTSEEMNIIPLISGLSSISS
ncbi:Ser/Thr/Tyr protein kinase RAD53 [Candida albicans P87]|nr:Ser/Thr/Tyr protein kinase RAD53 [Candida albicans P94015]KGQ98209.1 Ser/Thr/Tyr protein kinase RAD53 [Candida albicans GC75]KGU10234.1 Ser/Thr/Tyr protein kinase RAD53 [Candida albicans P87]KGU27239.1 Ser/Thr/Tyr protein kinase RAD53 [Candida albicans P34048]KHC70117.1 Ser/Thr/Tyr protein kinase RAD53 [Candida albicans P75016]KHC78560.1 Ser/Thr/Tyr protein kinase RAD53 [Candida albicans P78042]